MHNETPMCRIMVHFLPQAELRPGQISGLNPAGTVVGHSVHVGTETASTRCIPEAFCLAGAQLEAFGAPARWAHQPPEKSSPSKRKWPALRGWPFSVLGCGSGSGFAPCPPISVQKREEPAPGGRLSAWRGMSVSNERLDWPRLWPGECWLGAGEGGGRFLRCQSRRNTEQGSCQGEPP